MENKSSSDLFPSYLSHPQFPTRQPTELLQWITSSFRQPRVLLPLILISYPLLVRFLRYRRANAISRPFPTRASLAFMTPEQATQIQRSLSELEFPFLFEKAVQFALFRTYGIPSISSLLYATRQLGSPENACKRYSDTGLLIAEWMSNHWGNKRWEDSIARTNSLHEPYIKAGKISNADMLYTLSLFATEPVRWIKDWEWRELTDVEMCALGVFWKRIGEAMGIEFKGLPGYNNGKGWRDGLEWLDEITTWSQEYEKEYMIPRECNFQIAEQTTAILLWTLPTWAEPFGKQCVSVLMDDRLRKAMLYPKPPTWLITAIHIILHLRQFLLIHISLPRPSFLRHSLVDLNPSSSPDKQRHHLLKYDALPYYVRPTLWNRWGPEGLMHRAMGLPVPGDEGGKYFPEGYVIRAVGPENSGVLGDKGREGGLKRVQKVGTLGGCPFG